VTLYLCILLVLCISSIVWLCYLADNEINIHTTRIDSNRNRDFGIKVESKSIENQNS